VQVLHAYDENNLIILMSIVLDVLIVWINRYYIDFYIYSTIGIAYSTQP